MFDDLHQLRSGFNPNWLFYTSTGLLFFYVRASFQKKIKWWLTGLAYFIWKDFFIYFWQPTQPSLAGTLTLLQSRESK